jgi:hypothetical protein
MAIITIGKDLIAYEDINFATGAATPTATFSRETSSGGSQTLHKFSDKCVPLEDASSYWTGTNLNAILDDIKDGTEYLNLKYQLFTGTTDPVTAANQGVHFVKDGSTTAEPWPHYGAESAGDVTRYLLGGAAFKIWVYANTAQEGWVIDTDDATDRVLAFKGGSDAYNANGGTNAGTWTQPNHVHTFTLTTTELPAHVHQMREGDGDLCEYPTVGGASEMSGLPADDPEWTYSSKAALNTASAGTGSQGSVDNGATANTYRPAAAIGTMQFPDVGA